MAQTFFKSHLEEILGMARQAETRALEIIGGMAETHAVDNLTNNGSVDTGLLRNSITHAIGGEAPKMTAYQDDKGEQHGEYAGTAPEDTEGKRSVYIGTNVFYAPFVELGTSRSSAKPYLRPAIEGHLDEYQRVIETELRKG